MKKILTISLALMAATVFAKQLENYQEIRNAVKTGHKLTVVTDFSKCKTPMPIIGQLYPSEIMLTSNAIIFSANHFTTNNPVDKGKPINEYTTYILKEDDIVTTNTQIVTLPEYNVKPFAANSCLLNQDVKFYARRM